MSSLKDLRQEIDAQYSIKGLIEVYEEMAASSMKDVRDEILTSREYYYGLAKLSSEVGTDLSTLKKDKTRDAIVLLSSDTGMYGEILDTVFAEFLKATQEDKSVEIFIAGKVGADLAKTLAPKLHFISLPLPTKTKDKEGIMLNEMLKQLSSYRQVKVFFGQFKSIACQEPMARALTSQTLEKTKNAWAGEAVAKLKYLYEPDTDKIAEVFADQIFAGVFEQTYKEGELAKHASRLMHLDQAMSEIENKLVTSKGCYTHKQKRVSAKKLQSQFVGYKAVQNAKRRAYV